MSAFFYAHICAATAMAAAAHGQRAHYAERIGRDNIRAGVTFAAYLVTLAVAAALIASTARFLPAVPA